MYMLRTDLADADVARKIRFRCGLSVAAWSLIWLQAVNWRWEILDSGYTRSAGAVQLNTAFLILVPLVVAAFCALYRRVGRDAGTITRGQARWMRAAVAVTPVCLGLVLVAFAFLIIAFASGGGWG